VYGPPLPLGLPFVCVPILVLPEVDALPAGIGGPWYAGLPFFPGVVLVLLLPLNVGLLLTACFAVLVPLFCT